MKKNLQTLLLIIISANLFSQDLNVFPNLKRIKIGSEHLKASFSYDEKTTKLNRIKCWNLEKTHFLFCEDSTFVEYENIALYKSQNLRDSLIVVFSEGLSDDPMFSIFKTNGKQVGRVSALDFYLTSNGIFYTAGHTNNMFNKRRKFKIENDTIIEIKQPYYYVGLKGKILKPLTLYSDKELKNAIAQLPTDYEVEILLAETGSKDFEIDFYYLVKSNFGLVGWIKISNNDIWNNLIDGFFYAGD